MQPDVIWGPECREELLLAIEEEEEHLHRLQRLNIRWAPDEFHPRYPTLEAHLFVEPYYVDVLLDVLRRDTSYEVGAVCVLHCADISSCFLENATGVFDSWREFLQVVHPWDFLELLYDTSIVEDSPQRKPSILKLMVGPDGVSLLLLSPLSSYFPLNQAYLSGRWICRL